MKKTFFSIVIIITVLSLVGCGTPTTGSVITPVSAQKYGLQAVIDSPANGASLPNAPVVINYHATAQEGLSAIELSVDGKTLGQVTPPDSTAPLVTLTFTWTPLSSGEHVLKVRAQSTKGTWSDDAVVTVTIQGETNPQPQQQNTGSQNTPLQAVIDSPANGASLPNAPVVINYHATAQEGLSLVEISVDGIALSQDSPPDAKQPLVALKYTWTPTGSGQHVLRVRAKSSKGIWSDDAIVLVTIQAEINPQQQQQNTGGQNTPLQAVIDSPANGASLPNAPVVINYHATAQEGLSAIELSVDGKTLSQVSPTDTKAPLVTLTFTWTPLSSGEHMLRVRAQSTKGTWSDDAVVTVTVQGETNPPQQQQNTGGQNTPPQAAIDSPINGASLPNAPVEINYHAIAQEGISTVELTVDGKTLSQVSPADTKQPVATFKFTWTPLSSGDHVIRVRAQSTKGIWSDDAVTTVTIQGETNPQTGNSTNDEVQFIKVTKSTAKLFMSNCGTYKITFSVTITHPEKASGVYVFTRLWDREGEGLSSWDTGHALSPRGDGDYDITLTGVNIPNTKGFEFTILYYQFTVMDKVDHTLRIAHTDVYKDVQYDKCP
jgi:hypothetical protein